MFLFMHTASICIQYFLRIKKKDKDAVSLSCSYSCILPRYAYNITHTISCTCLDIVSAYGHTFSNAECPCTTSLYYLPYYLSYYRSYYLSLLPLLTASLYYLLTTSLYYLPLLHLFTTSLCSGNIICAQPPTRVDSQTGERGRG